MNKRKKTILLVSLLVVLVGLYFYSNRKPPLNQRKNEILERVEKFEEERGLEKSDPDPKVQAIRDTLDVRIPAIDETGLERAPKPDNDGYVDSLKQKDKAN